MKFGLIGNCRYSALVEDGNIEWLCWPRLDSSFVFGSMLDQEKGGSFRVEMVDVQRIETQYLDNTNILRTEFHGPTGAFELIDFAPRFQQYDRFFKPTMLCRILRPLYGEPLVRVICDPVYDYGRVRPEKWSGSNHIAWQGLPAPLRLTTNIPLTYVEEQRPFALYSDMHLALTWGQPLESALERNVESFLEQTTNYWHRWVKHTRVPRDYQEQVVRSALVLKLHQYEDTGAIIAATTTSLPEFPGSGRCWDYRYCWLRDTYFSLNAFERLGHFDEMEQFLSYLRNLCRQHGDHMLQPLYAIDGEEKIIEEVLDHLSGYRFPWVEYGPGEGDGPVRIGNQAYEHVQNDVYGEMILAISRLLIDRRFAGVEGRAGIRAIVDQLLTQIENRLEEPDAGLWELRNTQKLHSFSVLTHWAGAKRAIEIGEELGDSALRVRAGALEREARRILEEQCWSEERGALTQAAGFENLDAAMLLALHFGFWEKGDPKAKRHVLAIQEQLRAGNLLKRYDVEDDFGDQEAAFTVCSFWLVEALAIVGEEKAAKELFDFLLEHHNGLGLYSEDLMPETGRKSGNFPQTYSHVGLINAAFRLSRPWD